MNSSETTPAIGGRISHTEARAHRAAAVAVFAMLIALTGCGKPQDGTPVQKTELAETKAEAANEESPLAKAATRGDLTKVKQLVADGADVNASDALGRTPLHMAAFYGRPKSAGVLITGGAKVNATDRVGLTPLHSAVLAGGVEEIELLLSKNADIQAASKTGLTPLHLAAATGNPSS